MINDKCTDEKRFLKSAFERVLYTVYMFSLDLKLTFLNALRRILFSG